MNTYDFVVKNPGGKDVALSQYRGKVSLIVNSATQGEHASQLFALQALFEAYENEGFELFLFPCDQFGVKETMSNKEIEARYRGQYGMTCPIFSSVNVNGPTADRLYRHLVDAIRYSSETVVPTDMEAKYRAVDKYYHTSSDIKWDFTKFLIDRNGAVLKRYEPETPPCDIEADIKAAMKGR